MPRSPNPTPQAPWNLSQIATRSEGDRTFVAADLDPAEIWFALDGESPAPRPEAFASAMLMAAQITGHRIRIGCPVDRQWLANMDRLSEVWAEWWQYPARSPIDAAETVEMTPTSDLHALCFTGGVDSFYTLLHTPHRIDRLVFVHGFDVPLADVPRRHLVHQILRNVGGELGKSHTVVTTNLREHPAFNIREFSYTHGAALGAVGHVLSDRIGTLIIPASYRADRLRPWGSHPQTDPLFGGGRLRIIHDGEQLGRVQKITAIASHPLVRRNLRVCFENRTADGNCSRCEKCVMTMCAFDALGQLEHCEAFDRSVSLADRIDALEYAKEYVMSVWREVAAMDQRREVRAALDRLFARRQRIWGPRVKRLIRRGTRLVRRVLGVEPKGK